MQNEIIVIIGGPGSGKTSVINQLSALGHCCYPEVSRAITQQAKADGIDQLFLTNPILFSQKLLEGRIDQYKNARNEACKVVFIDRGIPDVLAYLKFVDDEYSEVFETACLDYKYSKIFVLSPWKEIYISDNERYESFEQSEKIHNHLVDTYKSYGYNLIEVPKESVENRVSFILNEIK